VTEYVPPLIPSAPLELNTDLRLHTQRLDLGKAELLTDALILPFTDIEGRLSQLALSTSDIEAKRMRKSMKSYLGRLNANPHIPLKFRLKVLNRFEQELNLFDGEMTAAVLNAHKIGVLLVQEKARSEADYYPVLIDMLANAIELSVKLLRLSLEQYRAQPILATRQFFDLARLGLDVAAASTALPADSAARLYKAVCSHELLRRLDFFAHPPAMQQRIWLELQHHIGVLTPSFLRQGSSATDHTGPLLLTNLNRPNDPAGMQLQLNGPLSFDAIVIPVHAFSQRLEMAAHHATSILHQPSMQKQALHTEHELENTLLGCSAILRALSGEQRHGERGPQVDARIVLHLDAVRAIRDAFSSGDGIEKKRPTTSPRGASNTWRIANLHKDGVCLERVDGGSIPLIVGALVSLHWLLPDDIAPLPFSQEEPRIHLGMVRWIKAVKPGEQRLGIEFIGEGYHLALAVMPGGGRDAEERRTWPVLLRQHQGKRSMILPETGIYRGMTLILSQAGRQAPFKVSIVDEVALNHTRCHIILANTTNVRP